MLLVIITALFAAGLTLFSGFGLGSLLLPAFAWFFPLHIAVAATAVVHLLNNLFKALLLGKHANWRIVAIFGIPGVLASFLGAWLLKQLAGLEPITSWSIGDQMFPITAMALAIGLLILVFAVFELHPKAKRIAVPAKFLALGGLASGFLGGLSGHQGALRSTFMVRLGLEKEVFLGTSIMCAVVIDMARISVYSVAIREAHRDGSMDWGLVAAGTLAAFIGSYVARQMIEKVTMEGIRKLVGWLLVVLGVTIAAGIIQ